MGHVDQLSGQIKLTNWNRWLTHLAIVRSHEYGSLVAWQLYVAKEKTPQRKNL